jgi:hypothetical protein
MRGLFVRGWSHGSNIDTGRVFGKIQQDMVGPHTHPYVTHNTYGERRGDHAILAAAGEITLNTGNNSGTETRPKNIALIYCIKT